MSLKRLFWPGLQLEHNYHDFNMANQQIISSCEIEALITKGQTIVIYEGYALRLDTWLDKHPGGRLAILHMVGRDATDEINV